MKQTIRQYWESQVNHQLYMLGVNFDRHYYADDVLPKTKIDTLKRFYHAFHELDMMRDLNESNAKIYRTDNTKDIDWVKVTRINKSTLKKKLKLVKELLHD